MAALKSSRYSPLWRIRSAARVRSSSARALLEELRRIQPTAEKPGFVRRRTFRGIAVENGSDTNNFRDVRNERICSKHRHNPTSLVSDGQKTKTRLVPPRALNHDRNFATCVRLPRLGSAPLTTNFKRIS